MHFEHNVSFAALMFMHLAANTLKKVQCLLTDFVLVTWFHRVLIQVLNLLWID